MQYVVYRPSKFFPAILEFTFTDTFLNHVISPDKHLDWHLDNSGLQCMSENVFSDCFWLINLIIFNWWNLNVFDSWNWFTKFTHKCILLSAFTPKFIIFCKLKWKWPCLLFVYLTSKNSLYAFTLISKLEIWLVQKFCFY